MGQKLRGHITPIIQPLGNGVAKMNGIPIDDDRREQVQPRYPVMLPFSGSVVDSAPPANARIMFWLLIQLPSCTPSIVSHTIPER